MLRAVGACGRACISKLGALFCVQCCFNCMSCLFWVGLSCRFSMFGSVLVPGGGGLQLHRYDGVVARVVVGWRRGVAPAWLHLGWGLGRF